MKLCKIVISVIKWSSLDYYWPIRRNDLYYESEMVCLEVTVGDDDLDIADDQEEVPDHYEALVRVLTVGENIYNPVV